MKSAIKLFFIQIDLIRYQNLPAITPFVIVTDPAFAVKLPSISVAVNFVIVNTPVTECIVRRRANRYTASSPLRDVAGMLRSFAYAASASVIQRGVEPPEGWEEECRSEFLAGYLGEVEPALLPYGEQAIHRLLMIFELEKAVYELRYELGNRPDWVSIPVAGILRMLEADQ